DLLELEGAESFRVLAYRRAATRMRETSGSVAQLALDGRAKELQGIGKTIEELKTAAEAERLRALPGLGAKSEEKILKALAFKAENPDAGRRLLGDGLPAVLAVVATLREHPAAVHVSEAG